MIEVTDFCSCVFCANERMIKIRGAHNTPMNLSEADELYHRRLHAETLSKANTLDGEPTKRYCPHCQKEI